MIFIWSRDGAVYREAEKLGLSISYSLRQYEKDLGHTLFYGAQAAANILNGIMQADIAYFDTYAHPSVHGAAVGQLKNKKGYRVLANPNWLMTCEFSVIKPTLKNLRRVCGSESKRPSEA